jgi:4-hydroxybenzoate polyprenyltransferase
VWSSARKAIVASPNARLKQAVTKVAQFEAAFEEPGPSVGEYLSALRPQQWSKNILVFVPLFSAHLFAEPVLLVRTMIAFVAFCCCASAGYLVNDLCDLPADRHHPSKRLRPFASGRLPLAYGFAVAPVLAVLGCLLAGLLSGLSLGVVVLYFIVAAAYSFSLKKEAMLDVFTLASL